uniref:Uncharacterized protein n=1 Tax=Arundo donax TaxID=35708 RepID=A0A0A8ZR54_ARUDO
MINFISETIVGSTKMTASGFAHHSSEKEKLGS